MNTQYVQSLQTKIGLYATYSAPKFSGSLGGERKALTKQHLCSCWPVKKQHLTTFFFITEIRFSQNITAGMYMYDEKWALTEN